MRKVLCLVVSRTRMRMGLEDLLRRDVQVPAVPHTNTEFGNAGDPTRVRMSKPQPNLGAWRGRTESWVRVRAVECTFTIFFSQSSDVRRAGVRAIRLLYDL